MKKPDLTRVNIEKLDKGEDFVVISKIAMKDFEFVPYEKGKGMEDGMETPFNKKVAKHVYHIEDHDIDVGLAITIGLGVIEDVASGERYLYNAEIDTHDNIEEDEIVRMGIYYQLIHPEYEDKKLDIILNRTAGGENYIRSLFNVYDFTVIDRLKEIFESHKGKGDNVRQFKKR
jgi:hypothetical protein